MAKKRALTNAPMHRRLVHHTANWLVPRHTNGFHPHLINRYSVLATMSLMILALGALFLHPHSATVLGKTAPIERDELVNDINTVRTQHGLTALQLNKKLSDAAFKKGEHMLQAQYWAHTSPNGVTPWKWINDAGYAYAYAGENLAKNFVNADATVAAWMASQSHKENMLKSYYTDVGVAAVSGELDGRQATIVVAMFATPASSLSEVASATVAPESQSLGFFGRIGVALKSMNTTTIGVLSVLCLMLVIALLTFIITHAFPHTVRQHARAHTTLGKWYQHHAILKSVIFVSVIAGSISLYSVGQL